MKRLRLGIIGTSDIAFRRFLPALNKSSEFEYVGVASRDIEKTKKFIEVYGGRGYASYDELLQDRNIDAVYLPLPPSLHFEWAKKALENGKHILMEKPFTTSKEDTFKLIELAEKKNLAIFENYMFIYHSQLKTIINMINGGELGEVRNFRISFGFPMRSTNDFRYDKQLGGGALLDCGGYTVKLATILLGDTAKVMYSKLNYSSQFEVDLYGSATLQNSDGIVAQLAFGMDNTYKCELEVWGSKASITATRIFTAGDGFEPELIVKSSTDSKTVKLVSDDQFFNAISDFYECIKDINHRKKIIEQIKTQSNNVEQIIKNN